jgi:hypothetical protein
MYFLSGPAKNLETIVVLATPYLPADQRVDQVSTKRAYGRYLAAYQPSVPRSSHSALEFVRDEHQVARLAELFGFDEAAALARAAAQDRGAEHRSMPDWKLGMLHRASDDLRSFDPTLASLFSLAIDLVFSTAGNTPPGGSMTTPRAVGVVWVQPRPTWASEDVIEAYVHELTHTLLMLDEHRHQHYRNYRLLDDERNFAASSIRAERRPLFAAIHSIVVAAELLSLRDRCHGHNRQFRLHPSSAVLRRQAIQAVESVRALPNLDDLITPRLSFLLGESEERLRSLRPQPERSFAQGAR